MVITDHINKLEATVTYGPPKEGGMLKSFRNKLFKTGSKELSDFIAIQISQKSQNASK
jgi:hypothetical protein